VAYIKALSKRLSLSNKNTFLHIASIGFSSSIRQFLLPLYYGASVVLLNESLRKELLDTIYVILEKRITVLDITPSHLSSLISVITENQDIQNMIKMHNVQIILTASEPLSKSLVEATYKIFGEVTFINMYGQTETSGIITTERIEELACYNKFIPLGLPLDCVNIRILNENGSFVEDGEVGEICITSPTVTSKILYNSKSYTSFKRYNFYGKFYKTGDYGKKLPNGKIEFFGRKGDFIKVNASRISIEEIKQNIMQYPDIEAVEVILLHKQSDAPELTAAVVPVNGKKLEASLLRSFLRNRIPNYMIPVRISILSEIPLNTNFKVDFASLTALLHKKENNNNQMLYTELKAAVIEVWKKVFDLEYIGEEEDFYNLGGNSLIAARIVIQINSKLSTKLKITDILYNDKISDLIKVIKKQQVLEK
jgi:aspartate racemase